MREITLKVYKELQEQTREREENPFSMQLDGVDNTMVPTAKAKEAEQILSKAKLTITLNEMRELQEQTREREENPFSMQLDGADDRMVPTAKAREAEQILSKAKLTITLNEIRKLQEQSREKEENPFSMQLDGVDDTMVPTVKAMEAEQILSKAEFVITLNEMRELQEQSREKEENPFSMQLDGVDDTMVPTAKAREAEQILSKAKLTITLDEMRELQEQSREKEENPFSMQLDGVDDSMVPTAKAREAEQILSKAKLTITLDEMRKLQEQTREKEENPFSMQLDGVDDRMVPTAKAREAEQILSREELTIALDGIKEKDNFIVTTNNIGKATKNVPIENKIAVKEKEENTNEKIKEGEEIDDI